jgi:hypothetical protein
MKRRVNNMRCFIHLSLAVIFDKNNDGNSILWVISFALGKRGKTIYDPQR